MPGEDSGDRSFFCSKAAALNRDHDAILQTLDRAVPTDDGGQFFYASESFEKAGDWNGIPLIFAQEHPVPEAYDADPEGELARIKGRVVGTVSEARIANEGHKRLMCKLKIDDAEVDRLIAEGRISLSTGFYAHRMEDEHGIRTVGPVTPHHVLLFIEDRTSLPRDLGTGVLNKKGEKNMAEEDQRRIEELEAQLAAMAEQLAAKDEQIAALTAENEELKAKLAEYEQAEADNKWNAVKNKVVPPGMVAKPEDESALRALMNKDPAAFLLKIEEGRASLEGKGPSGVSTRGMPMGNRAAPLNDAEVAAQLNKLRIPAITFEEGR